MMLSTDNRKILLMVVLVLTVLSLRIPVLFLWDNHLTGDDASLYMDTAINLAEGRGYHSNLIQVHIKDKDYLDSYVEKHGVRDMMEWIPPLYISFLSIIYLTTGFEHFLLGINLFNFFIFIVFLTLYIRFLNKHFADNFQVIIISLFIVGLNGIIFEFTFGAHMESLYLLTFFIAFLAHIKIVKISAPKFHHYVMYSVALSLFLFSKYSAIPFVAGFVLHHLYRKKYKFFIISSMITFLMVAPWMFIRSYIISGHPLSIFIRGQFPFSDSFQWTGFANQSIYDIYSYLREITTIFNWYLSVDYFFFFLPFALVFLLNKKETENTVRQTMLVLLVASFSFYAFIYNSAVGRYQYLLVVPILPYAIKELLFFVNNKRGLNLKILLAVLMIIFGSVQLIKITEFYNFARKKGIERSEVINEAVQLVAQNNIETDSPILSNILGFNLFTQNNIVLPPRNLTKDNKDELFKAYRIKYVLFCEGENYRFNNIFEDQELMGFVQNRKSIYLYKVDCKP